jgi:hypothetical protein
VRRTPLLGVLAESKRHLEDPGRRVRHAQAQDEGRQIVERRLEAPPREGERTAGKPRIEAAVRHEGREVFGACDLIEQARQAPLARTAPPGSRDRRGQAADLQPDLRLGQESTDVRTEQDRQPGRRGERDQCREEGVEQRRSAWVGPRARPRQQGPAHPPKTRCGPADEAGRQGASPAQGLIPMPAGDADRTPLLARRPGQAPRELILVQIENALQ